MKNISLDFKSSLQEEAGNLCICIRIVRTDGTTYGFTTWDSAFDYEFVTNTDSIGEVTFVPHNSFEPSDVSSSADLGVDNIEVIGVLSFDGIDALEFSAGLFTGAEVTVFRVDPLNLAYGEMIDKRGYVGEIEFSDDKYVCEILTSSVFARRNVGNITSPTCTVRRFCDNQCKLNIADFTHPGTTGTATPKSLVVEVTLDGALGVPVERISQGMLKIIYGGAILEREIKSFVLVSGNTYIVNLKESFGLPLDGNDCEIIEGCDRVFTTCISLNNAVNFRGMPHLPGTDTITQAGRAT